MQTFKDANIHDSPSMPAIVLYYYTFKELYCKIKNALFSVCFLYTYDLCESIINLLQYSTI